MVEIKDGEIKFKAEGILEYFKSGSEFLELLLLAINWTCGQAGRGTEMLSILYKNKMSADRNIYLLDGQVMIATEYHKSQAIMDDIKVVHLFKFIVEAENDIGHRKVLAVGRHQAPNDIFGCRDSVSRISRSQIQHERLSVFG
jgi:hypothetical protein